MPIISKKMGSGRFVKGQSPWNKGIKTGITPWLGKNRSNETKSKISQTKKGVISKLKGRKRSEDDILKIKHGLRLKFPNGRTRELSGNWRGGLTTYDRKLWLNNKRRIKKFGNGGFHTQGEWETLKAQYNWTCPACKKVEPEIKLTVDHIIPVIKGGSDNIENIQPLCKSCNCRKHAQIIKY